jgi:hypothetical protein
MLQTQCCCYEHHDLATIARCVVPMECNDIITIRDRSRSTPIFARDDVEGRGVHLPQFQRGFSTDSGEGPASPRLKLLVL